MLLLLFHNSHASCIAHQQAHLHVYYTQSVLRIAHDFQTLASHFFGWKMARFDRKYKFLFKRKMQLVLMVNGFHNNFALFFTFSISLRRFLPLLLHFFFTFAIRFYSLNCRSFIIFLGIKSLDMSAMRFARILCMVLRHCLAKPIQIFNFFMLFQKWFSLA